MSKDYISDETNDGEDEDDGGDDEGRGGRKKEEKICTEHISVSLLALTTGQWKPHGKPRRQASPLS